MRSLHSCPVLSSNLPAPIARSLSIQFALKEWLNAFHLLQNLQTTLPEQIHKAPAHTVLTHIARTLQKFLLFSIECPLALNTCCLDRLCFYCEILIQTSKVDADKMQALLEEMRGKMLQMKAQMVSWKKCPICPSLMQEALFSLLDYLKQKLICFFDAFVAYLQEARSDENVLTYLLEHKDSFNAACGKQYVEDMLRSFFPAGLSQLRAVIFEGYTRRGFSAFLSQIEPLIDAFEHESPCPQLSY